MRREERCVPLSWIRGDDAVTERDRLRVIAAPRQRPREPDPSVFVAGRDAGVQPEQRDGMIEVVPPGEQRCNAEDSARRRRIATQHGLIASEGVLVLPGAPGLIGRGQNLRQRELSLASGERGGEGRRSDCAKRYDFASRAHMQTDAPTLGTLRGIAFRSLFGELGSRAIGRG